MGPALLRTSITYLKRFGTGALGATSTTALAALSHILGKWEAVRGTIAGKYKIGYVSAGVSYDTLYEWPTAAGAVLVPLLTMKAGILSAAEACLHLQCREENTFFLLSDTGCHSLPCADCWKGLAQQQDSQNHSVIWALPLCSSNPNISLTY